MQTKYKVTWLYSMGHHNYPLTASKEFDSGTEAAEFIQKGKEYNLTFEVFIGHETIVMNWNKTGSIVDFLTTFRSHDAS